LSLIPHGLHAKLAFVQRAIDAQLNRKRFHGQLRLTAQFAGAFRQDVKETLFEPAALVTLPFFIVVGTEIDDVLARNVSWTTRRREHLALHGGLDFARDLYQKLFPNAARFGVFVGSFEQVFASFAVNPFSY